MLLKSDNTGRHTVATINQLKSTHPPVFSPSVTAYGILDANKVKKKNLIWTWISVKITLCMAFKAISQDALFFK